ncbi:MAG TPA: histidine triad nucleotide-binding protein [Acidimicrobiales bacterium]|nr:histidine triad nucleotide-binding protein [Acidimicrobiales bacterium]
MTDCLFCRIVAGELPSTEVDGTELSYAFRDINPGAPTHVLVVPRAHITDAQALGPDHGELLADMYSLANRIARSEGVSSSGYRLVFNVGDDSGNSVAHLHLHLLGGRRMGWPPG